MEIPQFTKKFNKPEVRGKALPLAPQKPVNTRPSHKTPTISANRSTSTEYTEGIKLPQVGTNPALTACTMYARS
jgi:hypothetical protein